MGLKGQPRCPQYRAELLLVAFDALQLGSDRDRGARARLLPVQNLREGERAEIRDGGKNNSQ